MVLFLYNMTSFPSIASSLETQVFWVLPLSTLNQNCRKLDPQTIKCAFIAYPPNKKEYEMPQAFGEPTLKIWL